MMFFWKPRYEWSTPDWQLKYFLVPVVSQLMYRILNAN